MSRDDDKITPNWDRRVIDACETPEITSAFDLQISERAMRRGADVARRNGRDPDAPLSIAEADALLRALARKLRDENTTARQESNRELRELLNIAPGDTAKRFAKEMEQMRADYRFAKRLLMSIGAPLLALSVWAVREIVTSQIGTATRDATIGLRLDSCEQRLGRVEGRIDNKREP